MRTSWNLVFCAGLAALGAGCGGGDGGYDTGLPSDALISELNDEQLVQACEATQDYILGFVTPERTARGLCIGAAMEEADAASCQQSLDACVEAFLEDGTTGETPDLSCDEVSASEVNGCDATVGAFETCVQRQFDVFKATLDSYDCELLYDAEATAAALERIEQLGDEAEVACGGVAEECGLIGG